MTNNQHMNMDNEEYVFYKSPDDGTIISGGFRVDSMLLAGGKSIMSTKNNPNTQLAGEHVSSIFKNLSIQ